MTANAGYHAYATGDVLTAAQVQYNLQNQTVMYFATTTARDAALTGAILVEGMVSYTPATGVMYYNGTAWTAVGSSSPLTTKGDLYTYSTTNARLPVGTNNQVLTADSAQTLGVKWATPTGSSPASASTTLNSSESTTSTSFGALTTAQSVTLTTGTNVLVILGANTYISSGTATTVSSMTYDISGATTSTGSLTYALIIPNAVDRSGVAMSRLSYRTVTAGSNTFTTKFATGATSTTSAFNYRSITVIDLGS